MQLLEDDTVADQDIYLSLIMVHFTSTGKIFPLSRLPAGEAGKRNQTNHDNKNLKALLL
jgi:hypothetical protein